MIDAEDRVSRTTAERIDQRIRSQTAERLAYYARHLDEIDARLYALEREWDIERTLQAKGAALAFAGVALGSTIDRRWLLLPALASAFLLQHAATGWCPPMAVLRRMGVRTAEEINHERYALKALRGDFDEQPARTKLGAVMHAIGLRPNGLARP